MRSATMTPAYGRRYNGREAVLGDWNDGKDFFSEDFGAYCSIRNSKTLLEQRFTHVTFRNIDGRILVNIPLKA